eukprot:GHVS01015694.1.p1 GENE.GHVS01015694.1~~GHVS01015694.1.p1  ORF type:complete len:181 (-),score=10.24 GHVS01015694.1:132-653(-)
MALLAFCAREAVGPSIQRQTSSDEEDQWQKLTTATGTVAQNRRAQNRPEEAQNRLEEAEAEEGEMPAPAIVTPAAERHKLDVESLKGAEQKLKELQKLNELAKVAYEAAEVAKKVDCLHPGTMLSCPSISARMRSLVLVLVFRAWNVPSVWAQFHLSCCCYLHHFCCSCWSTC